MHSAHVLHLSCIPEKIGINQNEIPIRSKGLAYNTTKPKGCMPKMREHKLRSGVNWQEH
jgi:hypothetical protein